MVLATALVAVACVDGSRVPRDETSPRLELLAEAFTALPTEPARAAELFARAGPGPILERARLEQWLECLERSAAPASAWRQLVAAAPPPTLLRRAQLGLGRSLLRAGEPEEAVATLEAAARAGLAEADEELILVADPTAREDAARRLATAAPDRVPPQARQLEARTLAGLTPSQWLQRSAAWRAAGLPRKAVRELESLRFSGDDEVARRLEVARSHLSSGAAGRALRVLRRGERAQVGELVARAEANRRLAWDRFPRRGTEARFRGCLDEAHAALRRTADQALRLEILALVLECATEAGDLEEAVSAWRRLAELGWSAPEREWRGRRLGIALARSPGFEQALDEIGSSLKDNDRCLDYWGAGAGLRRELVLRRLSEAPVADLYGQWARAELAHSPPQPGGLASAVGKGEPPASVRLLLDWGASQEALREWRRVRDARGATPAEALAAAELERSNGQANQAIRSLRAVFPELGGVELGRCPEDVVRAYLPLEWERELVAAARAEGVDPWLLAALARQETVFVAHARSPRGALGLVQLMPSTARMHASSLGLGTRPDLLDPGANLRLGARELAGLLRRFSALEPALAAYNAGESRAARWWRQWPDHRLFAEQVPIPETYTYIRRVSFLAEAYRLVYAERWRSLP